jgi:hypothetical protein
MEQHTDLATGARFRRQLLGGCLFGRLFLRPNTRSDRLDLYWSVAQVFAPDDPSWFLCVTSVD